MEIATIQNTPHQLKSQQQSPQDLVVSSSDSEQREVSVFARQEPATIQQVAEFATTLGCFFPQMPQSFWTIASRMIAQEKMSWQRLQYIMQYITHNHHYPTLTIADLIGVDKKIKLYTLNEYYIKNGTTDIVAGWCKLKERDSDGHTQFCKIDDAKAAGLEIEK